MGAFVVLAAALPLARTSPLLSSALRALARAWAAAGAAATLTAATLTAKLGLRGLTGLDCTLNARILMVDPPSVSDQVTTCGKRLLAQAAGLRYHDAEREGKP